MSILWTVIIILLILWILGVAIDLGAIVHFLIIAAIVLAIIRIIQMVLKKR